MKRIFVAIGLLVVQMFCTQNSFAKENHPPLVIPEIQVYHPAPLPDAPLVDLDVPYHQPTDEVHRTLVVFYPLVTQMLNEVTAQASAVFPRRVIRSPLETLAPEDHLHRLHYLLMPFLTDVIPLESFILNPNDFPTRQEKIARRLIMAHNRLDQFIKTDTFLYFLRDVFVLRNIGSERFEHYLRFIIELKNTLYYAATLSQRQSREEFELVFDLVKEFALRMQRNFDARAIAMNAHNSYQNTL